tara:strand:+ start:705 stop:857 length:153 start_codon:yes stop_codon:yes gene_type:complete
MENNLNSKKKIYLDNINKMPRLSKNQKVRRDTQKLLDEIKSKLNPRTFTS